MAESRIGMTIGPIAMTYDPSPDGRKKVPLRKEESATMAMIARIGVQPQPTQEGIHEGSLKWACDWIMGRSIRKTVRP